MRLGLILATALFTATAAHAEPAAKTPAVPAPATAVSADDRPARPAPPPGTTINLSDQEMQALVEIMDAGVRGLGLKSSQAAAVLLHKIQAAQQAKTKPQE